MHCVVDSSLAYGNRVLDGCMATVSLWLGDSVTSASASLWSGCALRFSLFVISIPYLSVETGKGWIVLGWVSRLWTRIIIDTFECDSDIRLFTAAELHLLRRWFVEVAVKAKDLGLCNVSRHHTFFVSHELGPRYLTPSVHTAFSHNVVSLGVPHVERVDSVSTFTSESISVARRRRWAYYRTHTNQKIPVGLFLCELFFLFKQELCFFSNCVGFRFSYRGWNDLLQL